MVKTVLVIDDDKMLRNALSIGLRKANFNVICAESAEDAVEILQRISVDAMVLDRMMTGVDGLTFLKNIRKKGRRPLRAGVAPVARGLLAADRRSRNWFFCKPVRKIIPGRPVWKTPPQRHYTENIGQHAFLLKNNRGWTGFSALSCPEKDRAAGGISSIPVGRFRKPERFHNTSHTILTDPWTSRESFRPWGSKNFIPMLYPLPSRLDTTSLRFFITKGDILISHIYDIAQAYGAKIIWQVTPLKENPGQEADGTEKPKKQG